MDARDGNEKSGMPPEYPPQPTYGVGYQQPVYAGSAAAAAPRYISFY
jgi:hypothetical protein